MLHFALVFCRLRILAKMPSFFAISSDGAPSSATLRDRDRLPCVRIDTVMESVKNDVKMPDMIRSDCGLHDRDPVNDTRFFKICVAVTAYLISCRRFSIVLLLARVMQCALPAK